MNDRRPLAFSSDAMEEELSATREIKEQLPRRQKQKGKECAGNTWQNWLHAQCATESYHLAKICTFSSLIKASR